MELRDINTFLVIAEKGKMITAAQALNYSQPTLTARMNKLEEELGCKLFNRYSQGVTLTNSGKEFLSYAYQISRTTDEAIEHMTLLKNKDDFQLVVGASFFSSCYVLPKIISEFCCDFPDVFFHVNTMKGQNIIKAIEGGTVNIGFGRLYAVSSNIEIHTLENDPIVLCVYPNHEICKKEIVEVQDLADDFILANSSNEYWKWVCNGFESRGLSLKIRMSFDNIETIKRMVIQRCGISFLPASSISEEVKRGSLVQRYIKDIEIYRESCVYSKPFMNLKKVEKELLRKICKNIG